MPEPHTPPAAAHATGHPEQEPDLESIRTVLVITVVVVVLTILFSLGAAVMVDARTGRFYSPTPRGPDTAVLERTNIEFHLFDLGATGLEKKDRDRARLHGSGWVDREQGIAHVPIDVAMQMTVDRLRAEARAAGGGR